MGILFGLIREMTRWDIPSKIALLINIVLLVIAIAIASTQPDLRTPSTVAIVGLVISLQVIVLWGNRNLVTPYTQAQRHFLAGEFEQARDVLESYIQERQQEKKSIDVDVFVVLGNAYRNLGELERSEQTLQVALNSKPEYHFALYGIGKTLLAQGDYSNSIDAFKTALANDGYLTTYVDIALAQYLLGNHDDVAPTLRIAFDRETQEHTSVELNEPHRQLMSDYLLWRVDEAQPPHDKYTIQAGIEFWDAEAKRFSQTPYGQAIYEQVEKLRTLL